MEIADYFIGKNVFITGGSGFLGKLLIEKLLRSCPGVGNIYMLLRPKKGNSIEERLEKIKALPVFDLLKKENPNALKRIIPVKGDVCAINLGLSDSDRRMLTEKVNIIYHTAASVRFDDFLKDAIILNVRGTREVVQLALDLKHISILVHISTMYCNSDKFLVEEKLYPSHGDWRDAIRLAEEYDVRLINALTEKYIQPLPNTYTLTKSLAEHCVSDLCKGKIPSIIARPSVVVNTLTEPLVGWNDNFNGPVGLLTAGGKGLLRVVLGRREAQIDYIPADCVIKSIILATHASGIKKNPDMVEVYNVCQNNTIKLTQGELVRVGAEICKKTPFSFTLWYPRFSMIQCWYSYYIQVILFHMLPALFIDLILRMAGKKPMLFNIQRKIYIANTVLRPFMSNTFSFINEKVWAMQRNLKKEDYTFAFKYQPFTKQEIFDSFTSFKIGTALYILKEKFDFTGIESTKRLRRYWYADMATKTIFFSFCLWIVICKIRLLSLCLTGLENYVRALP